MIVFISVCGTTCENVEDFVICLKEEVVSVCNTDMASKGAFHWSELAGLIGAFERRILSLYQCYTLL